MTERLASKTLRNSMLVVGARAVAKLAVFVVVVLLWRHLGADNYGRFATMIVYVTLLGIVADLGLQTVFIRDASRDRTVLPRYLGNLLSARLLLSLLALVILAAILRLLSPALFPYTLAAFVLLLTTSYSSLLRAVFYIRGRLGYEAIAIVAESFLLLGLTIVAIQQRATWDAFLWVYAASYLFTCLFAYGVIRFGWHERVTIRLDALFVRRLLAAGLPLALAFTITTIYAQLDIVLLQLFKNFQVVGWYSAANKYIDAVAWVPQSAMGAVFPALSLLAAGDRRRLAFAYEKSYKMLAILGLPLAVGLGVTADSVVHVTRGFEQSIPALRILAPSVALLFVNNAFIYTLTAINRQLDFTRLALVTLAVNVVLNLALIPPYGYLGAAAASTVTEVALFAGGWWLLRGRLTSLSIVGSIAPVLASAAIMGIVVYSVRTWPLVVLIIIGAAVYLAGLLGLRALNPEEWSIVRSGFRGR
ncbi:MAG TPA: flippase [Candidatus Dormibacteraeota bacterium]|nr:flippase [Candidatus Dormibacteraeota bacterium]